MVPYVVGLGTRLYLSRGRDPEHAVTRVGKALGRELDPGDVYVRLADPGDLDLADYIPDTAEIRAWREAVEAL